jgi:predicted membrane protein
VTQYAVAEEADDLETIIGLLTGALIVILSLIIVAVLFWRSNRFANNKDHQPQGNNHYYFTNPVLSPP